MQKMDVAEMPVTEYMHLWNQRFVTMYDYVHIDGNCFCITKFNTNFYLVPGE